MKDEFLTWKDVMIKSQKIRLINATVRKMNQLLKLHIGKPKSLVIKELINSCSICPAVNDQEKFLYLTKDGFVIKLNLHHTGNIISIENFPKIIEEFRLDSKMIKDLIEKLVK